jgi:hypothetical protein
MNEKSLTAVKKKHKSYRRYLQTREGIDYQTYISDRNNCTKVIRQVVREFENQIAQEAKKNPKGFWRYYNRRLFLNPASQTSKTPKVVCESDQGKADE